MEEKEKSIQEQMAELERKKLELEQQRLELEEAKLKQEKEQLNNKAEEPKPEEPVQQKSSFGGCLAKGCGLIIIGLIGLFILAAVVGSPNDSSSSVQNMSITERKILARNYAEDEWKKHLKDPRSYESIYDDVTADGLGSYIVYVRYRAKNSFGAYDTGFFKYKITFDGDICRKELLDYSK